MKCFLIAAITADGFVAQRPDQVSTSWTSGADKKWFSQKTKAAGVVVMGSTTFKTINRALPGRLTIVYTQHPETVAEFDPAAVQATTLSPRELIEQLKDKNYSEVAICGGSSIYSQFIKAGVVTDLYLTVEPIVFGKGVPLFAEPHQAKLLLKDTQSLAENVLLLHYEVLPNSSLAKEPLLPPVTGGEPIFA